MARQGYIVARFSAANAAERVSVMVTKQRVNGIEPVSNDAEEEISATMPYRAQITIEGIAPFLYHRWSNEAVKEKAVAAKGSKAKKSDNVESYVWRNTSGELCIPGEYLRQAVIQAAKYHQDPRSPRKSAMDLFKAGIVSLTELAPTGLTQWDYLDQRRVMVQRQGITRQRPALNNGWRVTFILQVQTPEYIPPMSLNSVISEAGRLIGIGDFRPSYGRFIVTSFEELA